MNKFIKSIIMAATLLLLPFSSKASNPIFDLQSNTVSNWHDEAKIHLGLTDSDLNKSSDLRCIKLNNYWCLKDMGWLGGIGHDSDNHTAFNSGVMAARAAVRNFRSAYIRHKRHSAYAIMSAYAPPDDCVGSEAARLPDGTCKFGKNDTKGYAKRVAKGLTSDVNSDLKLFDKSGKATEALIIFMANMAGYELAGKKVIEATIKKGICLENDTCKL